MAVQIDEKIEVTVPLKTLISVVSVIVIVCVTRDRSGEVFLGGHEEGGD